MAESRELRGGEDDPDRKKRRWRANGYSYHGGGGEAGKEPETAEFVPLSPPALMDPLAVLGPDVMEKILEFCDARSVARCLAVSHDWQEIARSDRIWAPKCEKLWEGKAHIPRLAKLHGASKLTTFSMSIMDGKRARIMRDDLCGHVWEFRFKNTAPEYWRNLDPSWKGTGPPMRRYFHWDGSHTADHDDKVWGGHECTYSIVTSYVGQGKIRNHYVRINRWYPMTVSRREDWSWEMSNHLYCYNSVPDAEKGCGTGPLFPVW